MICGVALQPIVVSIFGGSGLNGITLPLEVSAVVADPNDNDPSVAAIPIEYYWDCQFSDGSSCSIDVTGPGQIKVAVADLVEATYYFSVTAVKGSRSAFAYTQATVSSTLDVNFNIVE